MSQTQMQIIDAKAAANAYAAMGRLGVVGKFPEDAAELSLRLKCVSGRGRSIATALQTFVDFKGFDVLAEAVGKNEMLSHSSGGSHVNGIDVSWADTTVHIDTEAMLLSTAIHIEEPENPTLTYSASGLY
jgi:hypothetical protein